MTNTLYGFNAMEVQEAFVKIREQVSPDPLSYHLPTCEDKRGVHEIIMLLTRKWNHKYHLKSSEELTTVPLIPAYCGHHC